MTIVATCNCGLLGCSLDRAHAVTDAGMAFVQCQTCGVLRIPEEYLIYDHVDPDPVGPLPLVFRILFGMRLLWLSRELPALRRRDLRILDLGCGDGQFLEYLAARGYSRLVGIEPDATRAANARLRGVPVFESTEEAQVAGKLQDEIDLIIVWHVLEHVERPAEFLTAHAHRLAPGGTMLISVPNQAGIQTRLFGKYSAFPDYGRHIWYHTARYRAWLGRALPGFAISILRDRNFEYEIFAWVESIVSIATRNPTIVNRTLKKRQGGPARKLAIAAASMAVLPFAVVLAPLSIGVGRPSTLTFKVSRP